MLPSTSRPTPRASEWEPLMLGSGLRATSSLATA